MRHQDELLAERQWLSWDTFFADHFRTSDMRLTQEPWQELLPGFDAGFWAHAKAAMFGG
jgi:hypothetical protein